MCACTHTTCIIMCIYTYVYSYVCNVYIWSWLPGTLAEWRLSMQWDGWDMGLIPKARKILLTGMGLTSTFDPFFRRERTCKLQSARTQEPEADLATEYIYTVIWAFQHLSEVYLAHAHATSLPHIELCIYIPYAARRFTGVQPPRT